MNELAYCDMETPNLFDELVVMAEEIVETGKPNNLPISINEAFQDRVLTDSGVEYIIERCKSLDEEVITELNKHEFFRDIVRT